MTMGQRLKRAAPFVVALGIWFFPVPAGLTAPAWHLFAVFAAAIASVLIGAFPLLTASMLAVGAIVLTGTIKPEQAYSGFANSSVLLVVIAFIVAQAVVKSGLGRRVSLFMVSRFGGSSLGLAYSLVLTDAAIAPAFPSNTARGGVLFPIVLSVAKGAGSNPEDPEGRRLGGYLMFCSMAGLAVSSALWMTATSANPVAVQIVQKAGLEIDFGEVAPRLRGAVARRDRAPAADRREALPAARGQDARSPCGGAQGARRHGQHVARRVDHGRDLRADGRRLDLRQQLHLNTTSVAFMGFGVLLFLGVITLDDITKQGDTLVTFLWLAVLFAMSAQLNELGFMGYVGERLASGLGGLSWTTMYVTLIVLYVLIHYMFVSQTSQVLALFGVFLDVGTKGGVPLPLMAFGLLFASSYFSVITPQGGSQNIIFAASGYLTQRELYTLGALITLAFLAVYLLIGSPWVYFVMR